MSKKMKIIPSIFMKIKEPKHPWQWPSCKHPKTLSFRASGGDNSPTTYLDVDHDEYSSDSTSYSTNELRDEAARSLEVVISGVRLSERLFFEPEETKSIVKYSKNGPFKDSVAMALESEDPYSDFKKSMEEMVASHEMLLKDWDCLEELLLWYLKMNGEMNHRFIVGAFVDLLVEFAGVDSEKTRVASASDSTMTTTTTTSYSSASSSFSSPSPPLSLPT